MTFVTNIISVIVILFVVALIIGNQSTSTWKHDNYGSDGIFKMEPFAIQYGLPPSTGEDDHGHIKNLITLGSQADANKKYDVVSTEQLGDISTPEPPAPEPPPPDPVCFMNDE